MTWKIEQLRLVLDRAGVDTDLLSPFIAGPGERRRVALHARKGGASGAILGFKARRSWSVVALSACVVAEPRLQDALPRLSRLAVPFLEHPKSAPILHVTATDSGLAVEVTGVQGAGGGLSADARAAACTAAEAANVAQVTLGGEVLYQARPPLVSFGRAMVVLPPGGFLQAVARAEEAMASIAVEALAGCGRVADLFCGSGAFTFRLAERFSVQALDASEDAVVALRAGRGGASGMKAIAADVRDLYRRPLLAAEMKGIDGALLDPPRAGALDSVGEIGRSKLAVAVYVSCNPATFARDAAVLIGSGFRLTSVTPVDQFLWSPHMELVGVFHR
jgi:23S rRNA (uracil1939-C5)-methyltransferase